MKRILIFSGTTEGRKLAERLAALGLELVVCVATEYGEQVMNPLSGVQLHIGRMDCSQMQEFMKKEEFLAVVDATHPFALEVSDNIKHSAGLLGLTYFRLKRDTKAALDCAEDLKYFATNEECFTELLETEGNILLTTGSKELEVYSRDEGVRNRLFVRVLPNEESISVCRELGLSGRQIIAMQGPFTMDMNKALIRQCEIKILVSKESGAIGGFEEKVKAVMQTGISMYVISNPENQDGFSFDELCAHFMKLTGKKLVGGKSLEIALVGIGMGDEKNLTIGAKETIQQADYIFGARRLLSGISDWKIDETGKVLYPYYLAEDIIPKLSEIWQDGHKKAAVLFSGDSGFYSGAQKLYQSLLEWKEEAQQNISFKILPGISTISYFSSACRFDWNSAKLLSVHGRGSRDEWGAELLFSVRFNERVIVLVSGPEDVCEIGRLLNNNGWKDCKIVLGYQLSYPNEKIMECTPQECEQIKEEGLYVLSILNNRTEKYFLAPCKKDDDFVRGKIPMTKEEIRELVICKLRLTRKAVVYDVGSGTGSLAVEIAERSGTVKVYAIEQKEEAVNLINENKSRFGLPNIEVIHKKAPAAFEKLPAATHAFIGGSSGNLEEILLKLHEKSSFMRVVITAISLETIGKLTTILKNFPIAEEEIIQVQVSRSKGTGNYHLMQSENSVYICSFCFADDGHGA